MAQYIDAEKLIAEIVKLKNSLITLMNKVYYAANYKEWKSELNGYNKILSIVNSLKQEQPDIDDLKREWYDKGYLEGRNNAHITARELGLPKSYDFQQEHQSFSSNLDDAAETFNRVDAARMWDYEGKTEGEIVEESFKAGAAWMERQGRRTTGKIIPLPTDDRFNWLQVDDDIQLCGILTGFNIGDKVTIQILKK